MRQEKRLLRLVYQHNSDFLYLVYKPHKKENHKKKVWDKVEQIDAQKNNYLEWYKKIIDNMTESIFILNKDRHFIYINKKWIKTLGYNLQKLKTKTLR